MIGAGSSGIAAAKALHERAVPFDCFEVSDRVGGNWAFQNPNGMSSAYRSLHINTSRERMEYADFPMPADLPDYPHHTHIAKYFNDYVDHFGLRERITFGTAVEHAERSSDGVWEISLSTGELRRYDALIVANGHHWDPRWPEPPFPGQFSGEQLHAHQYLDNVGLRDKAVLVVGIGNSAMDIAVECSRVAKRTVISSRRGAWILPKYMFGRPLDQLLVSPLTPLTPWPVRRSILTALYRVSVGPLERYGLPRPDHRLGEAHPTVSSDFLNTLAHGELRWRPNISRLDGERVRFEDGTSEQIDTIIWCTGYKVTFPFFDQDLISAPDNDLPLYKRVFKPGIDNLCFIALLQPLGATMPIAEAQGKWVAAYLRGEYHLPPVTQMERITAAEREKMLRRYVASKRHTMEVDFDGYLYDLRRERSAGARRARASGFALPVAPLARRSQISAATA